jgi:membrane protease YdiL (CAAX protease family)
LKEHLIATAVVPEQPKEGFRPVAAAWHTVVILAAIAAAAIRGSLSAEHMRSLGNADRVKIYERTIFFEWLMLALVLLGVWLKGSSLLTVLGEKWRSAGRLLRDVGIGVVFLLATIAVTSIFGSHRGGGDKAVQFLLPQGRREALLWVLLSVSAGICEEAVYRGYLQKQFMALTKNVPAGIVLSSLIFGAAHSYQGFARASQIAMLGAMGGVLAYMRRSVRPGMIAHALQDVLGGFLGGR